MMTSAPKARRSFTFSWLILSGRVKMQRYPLMAAAMARARPVLPLVPSTTVPPGFNRPAASAASIMARPMGSFTDPPGFMNSNFPYTGVRIPSVTRFRRTRGVQPTIWRTSS